MKTRRLRPVTDPEVLQHYGDFCRYLTVLVGFSGQLPLSKENPDLERTGQPLQTENLAAPPSLLVSERCSLWDIFEEFRW